MKAKKQILLVDDADFVLESLCRMLRSERHVWDLTSAESAKKAWDHLLEADFDAVVSDVNMPGTNGLELLQRIRQTKRTKDIPVVMLTGMSDRELRRRALDLGATDLLNKPVEPEDLLARLRSSLQLKASQDQLKAHNELLERRVEERTEELSRSRLEIIWRLGKAAEQRDEETGNHVIRVGCTSRVVAEVLGMDRSFVETLFLAAPLHDIGKIGVPDRILRKRGPLSPTEQAVMRQHCLIGASILGDDCMARTAFLEWRGTRSRSEVEGVRNPFLQMAASIALTHHEKWDGTGYPQGLAGTQIPLESRIVAICDVFDAMTSRRPYKKPYPEHETLHIIQDAVGSHFDPDVHAAFLSGLPQIRSIRKRFADDPMASPEAGQSQDQQGFFCGVGIDDSGWAASNTAPSPGS